jgi:hypothetical protein
MNLLDKLNFVGYVGLSHYGIGATRGGSFRPECDERFSDIVGKGPRMPVPNRLNWWTWALLAIVPFQAAWSQERAKDAPAQKDAPAKAAEPKKEAPPEEKAAAAEPEAELAKAETAKPATVDGTRFELTENYRDPRVDAILDLSVVKETLPPRPNFSANEERQLQSMAGGSGDINPRIINRFVEAKAAELTNKKAIETMMTGEGSVNSIVRPIEKATTALLSASRASIASSNSPFMTSYAAAMIKTFPPLLEGHLISRTQATMALASTGSLDVVPTLIKLISDEKQPWQVKSLALLGINNSIGDGRKIVAFNQRTQWTIAVINMLRNEEDAPWFLKSQAAQLIGNLRIISESVPERKVHPAEVLMDFLIDKTQRPEVRLEAARALGLLDITSQFRPYNHQLVAVSTAEAIADIAQRVSEIAPTDSSRAQQLVAMMAERTTPAFQGIQGVVNSGFFQQMSNSSADAKTQDSVKALFDKIKGVINAGSAYIRARGDLVIARRTDLQSQIADLRKAIEENQPKNRTLVTGGKSYEAGASASDEVAQGAR